MKGRVHYTGVYAAQKSWSPTDGPTDRRTSSLVVFDAANFEKKIRREEEGEGSILDERKSGEGSILDKSKMGGKRIYSGREEEGEGK